MNLAGIHQRVYTSIILVVSNFVLRAVKPRAVIPTRNLTLRDESDFLFPHHTSPFVVQMC